MKKILLLVIILVNTKAFGQITCITSLSIATPTGWTLVAVNPAVTPMPVFGTTTVAPFVQSLGAGWLFLQNGRYATYTFVRTINVCREGDFRINFNAAADNSITILLDNNTTPVFVDNVPGTAAFTTLYPCDTTAHLACGQHTLTAIIVNQGASTGFILNGTISTIDGCLSDAICECIPVEPNCCQNTLPVWTDAPVPQTNAFAGGTLSFEDFNIHAPGNSIPITEIKVTVEDFTLISSYENCISCNISPALLGSIFSGGNIGTGTNTLTTQPYLAPISLQTNNNEIIWENDNGAMLNAPDRISILYIFPQGSGIPCCADSARICIRITYKDVNCGICEIRNCTTVPLRSNAEGRTTQKNQPLPTLKEVVDGKGKRVGVIDRVKK